MARRRSSRSDGLALARPSETKKEDLMGWLWRGRAKEKKKIRRAGFGAAERKIDSPENIATLVQCMSRRACTHARAVRRHVCTRRTQAPHTQKNLGSDGLPAVKLSVDSWSMPQHTQTPAAARSAHDLAAGLR